MTKTASSLATLAGLLTLLFFYCSLGSSGLVYPIHPNVFTFDNWAQLHIRQLHSADGPAGADPGDHAAWRDRA